MYYDNNPNTENLNVLAPPSHEQVERSFDQLRGDIISILNHDKSYQETIQKLETELGVYKRAYADLSTEKSQLELLKQEVEKQRDDLNIQMKGHRVVTLIDGDGAIFSPKLIEKGQVGGHAAASMLMVSITQYLQANIGSNHYQIWVYVFLNKHGLLDAFARHLDTFGRLGKIAAKAKLDDFITGFNQAAERFMIIDVGAGKEAADAKIKALLESEIRLSQTEKVIFGGSHDNGYVTTLRSQITAGFKGKLILLPSYTEIAAGISELGLPELTVPDLFISEKLGGYAVPSTERLKEPDTDLRTYGQNGTFEPKPLAPGELDASYFSPRPSSHTTSLRASPPIPVEADESSSSSDSDEIVSKARVSPPPPFQARPLNPKLPLLRQKPPPCTLYYLSSCKHGTNCKFAHDYLLQPQHFAEMRTYAKRSPCPASNKGEICTWGPSCCYGHKCPYIPNCHFLKQGRCRFTGPDTHTEPK